MCVAGSGGGTRFARLPPVIEIIPHSGYLTHCVHLALTFDKFGGTRRGWAAMHSPPTILQSPTIKFVDNEKKL